MSKLLWIHWPQEFVVDWTNLIAETFGLSAEYGWARKPFRPGLPPRWLRGPLLSYADQHVETEPFERNAAGFAPNRFRVLGLSATDDQLMNGQPVVMRLNLASRSPDNVLSHSLSQGCRNRLRKSLKSGLEFNWVDQSKDIRGAWSVLEIVHRRLGSPLLPFSLLHRLHSQNIVRVGVVNYGTVPVAMLAMVIAGKIAWIPWCGANASYHHLSPNHLSHWEAINLALELDCEVFDFGRSGYLSGTYEFKRKWGAAPVPIVERTETRLRYAKVNYGLSQAVSKGWRLLPKPLTSRLGPVVFPAVAL